MSGSCIGVLLLQVKLVEFQSPGKFFVQLVDNVDLLRLQCTLNQVSTLRYSLNVYFIGRESSHIHRQAFECREYDS